MARSAHTTRAVTLRQIQIDMAIAVAVDDAASTDTPTESANLASSQRQRLARLDTPQAAIELGDGGQSMQGASEDQASWLRRRVNDAPRSANTILVTHQPNLSKASPDWGSSVADGETVVLRPDGRGGVTVIGRIPIEVAAPPLAFSVSERRKWIL